MDRISSVDIKNGPLVASIKPISPISDKMAQEREEKTKLTPQGKNTKKSDDYIKSYTAQIDEFLQGKNPNPRGAYDHIRHSGIPDIHDHMDACLIIYEWLYKQIDTKKVSDSLAGRIGDIVMGMMTKDPVLEYLKLMEEVSKEIQRCCTLIKDMHYVSAASRMGTSMPIRYVTFLEKIPKNSPLGVILSNS